MTTVNVRDFGATGDGITDDRVAVQAALDAGAEDVFFPNGNYASSVGALGMNWHISTAGMQLRGEIRDGVILTQLAGQPSSTRLLHVDHADVTITNMTLDGNALNQTADEHRAGVFAINAPGLTLLSVTAQNFTGDGFYVSFNTNNIVVDDVVAIGNDRNGITFGGGTVGAMVTRSRFIGNKVQQIDSEPGIGFIAAGVTIKGCFVDPAGMSSVEAVSVGGSSAGWRSANWLLLDNVINGAISIAWAQDVILLGNTIFNPTVHAAIAVYRSCDRIEITDNNITLPSLAVAAITVVGTGTGQVPDNVIILHNKMFTGSAQAFGISMVNAKNVNIDGNTIVGFGVVSAGIAGIYMRPTITTEDMQRITVHNNNVSNFGQYGLMVNGSGAAKILILEISNNTWGDTRGSQHAALHLDDGTGAAKDVRLSGSVLTGGCTLEVARPPSGIPQALAGQRWLVA